MQDILTDHERRIAALESRAAEAEERLDDSKAAATAATARLARRLDETDSRVYELECRDAAQHGVD